MDEINEEVPSSVKRKMKKIKEERAEPGGAPEFADDPDVQSAEKLME